MCGNLSRPRDTSRNPSTPLGVALSLSKGEPRAAASGHTLQRGDLPLVEVAELAGTDMLVVDRTNPHAAETDDEVADRFAHLADLPVTSLVNHQGQHRVFT